MKLHRKLAFGLVVALVLLSLPAAFSQSTTAGDIAGVVTDPTGALVPGASVTLNSRSTGTTQSATTNAQGYYRFALLAPGQYTVTVTAAGFGKAEKTTPAAIGQLSTVDFHLEVAAQAQTVEITENAATVQTENGDIATTIVAEQLANLPNPGNDLSYVAQLAPGAVTNTQGGYGNFEVFGLPATSNVFTYNGQYDNDPFLNLNNSGATNLLLGNNDVAEVNVVVNGYSGQYGGLAGAQVNYVSKSGANQFHGNGAWFWNGRIMNANDWFNNAYQVPRPFDNVNQWAAGFGGPIRKDKTFFYWNYEGLRVLLPTSGTATIPSPQFESATIANLNATGLSASVPFYQNMFNLYNAAPGAGAATPTPGGGCSDVVLPAPNASAPCTLQFRSVAGNFTHEYQTSLRIDQNIGQNDRIYGRVQTDQGLQATYTDAIDPIFNARSNQPEYQGQLNYTHSFGARATNQFVFSGQYYSAIFSTPNLQSTLNAFPSTMIFLDGSLNTLGGEDYAWPEGRNVKQWQIVDDFTITFGRHTFKAGINWRKNNVADYDYGLYTSGLVLEGSLNNFYDGGVAPGGFDYLQQKYLTAPYEPMALWNMGIYGQDEFRIGRNLKITAALRIDHNANPQCNTNCFSQFAVPFTELDHDPTIPYDQAIQTNLHTAYYGTDKVVWEPRVGFAWSPNEKTVVRGGVGIFSDGFPAGVVDNFSSNSPTVNTFIVTGAPLSPAQSGNLFSLASGSNSSFNSAFAAGGTLASIEASNPFFSPPSFSSEDPRIRQPHYYEWNLEVQRELGWNTILDLNYVGNHGAYEPLVNAGVNAYCPTSACPGGFAGLPTAPPDSRFGTVTEYASSNYSNYDGFVVRLNHSFSKGLLFQVNYVWSHALDVCSNGCIEPFNLDTAASILSPQNPFDARANYGNADYDVRHYFSANYVWDDVIRRFSHWGPNAVLGGWTVSGTWFVRTGFPLTVVDNAASGTLSSFNDGGPYFANVIGSGVGSCGEAAAGPSAVPCLNAGEFSASTGSPTAFGNQGRNTFRGPGYFNTDLAISKSFRFPSWESAKLTLGAQAFNLLNHPNFDLPVNDLSNTNPTTGFGDVTRTVNPPTSLLGSFLGGDASTRMVQVKLQFQF
jgi:hypothetical protein